MPIQKEMNMILKNIYTTSSFRYFLSDAHKTLLTMFDIYKIAPKKTKCNWCKLCTHLHQYFRSDEYEVKCQKAFKVKELQQYQNEICTSIYSAIFGHILSENYQ